MTAAHAIATQSDPFADFLRVGGAILTMQAAFWLCIVAGFMVLGWILYFLKPFIVIGAKALFLVTKVLALVLIVGVVFAALGQPSLILHTVFYTGYAIAKTVGTVVGAIIGV